MRSNELHSDVGERLGTYTRDDLAQLLQVSLRHVAAMNSSGRLPRPIRLGRAVRWLADEFHEWLEAGAPTRDRWEALKAAKRTGGRA